MINVNNGQWVRKDTSIGAGIDSYYEYLIKGYIVSGDPRYIEQEQTEPNKQPIRACYLGHVTDYQPIRDQYFLIRSVHARYIER